MRMERCGEVRWRRDTVLGCRCSPSAMMVYHGGDGLCVGGSDINPARPGALDANGGMAFSVCVKHVAPAYTPASPCS